MESQSKICNKCNQSKPLEDFYLHQAKGVRRADCKVCCASRVKSRRDILRLSHPNFIKKQKEQNLIQQGKKICLKCSNVKTLDHFRIRKSDSKTWIDSACEDCKKANQKIWRSLNRQNQTKANQKWCKSHPERVLLYAAKSRAKKSNLCFDLQESDILIPELCPVLGVKLAKGSNDDKSNSPSLDRIKPNLGYTKGNVIVISYRANQLKSDATIAEMESVLDFMRKNNCN